MDNNSQTCISSSFDDIRSCDTDDNRSKISSKGSMNMKLSVGKDRHFSRQTNKEQNERTRDLHVDLGNWYFMYRLDYN